MIHVLNRAHDPLDCVPYACHPPGGTHAELLELCEQRAVDMVCILTSVTCYTSVLLLHV